LADTGSNDNRIAVSANDASRILDEMQDRDEQLLVHFHDNDQVVQRFLDRLQLAAAWSDPSAVSDESLSDGEGESSSMVSALALLSKSQRWDVELCQALTGQYDAYLSAAERSRSLCHARLLNAETVTLALKVLTKSRMSRDALATTLKSWERTLGVLRHTELTDHLSLRLLTVNAKSGQVGRVLALLKLRGDKRYEARPREFQLAIRSIRVAQRQHRERNLFVSDSDPSAVLHWNEPSSSSHNVSPGSMVASSAASTLPITGDVPPLSSSSSSVLLPLDNPTRWLDAILINMKSRNVPLTSALAAQMLWCYSSGYTGKATHHFYRVKRRPVSSISGGTDGTSDFDSAPIGADGTPNATSTMPIQTFWDREERAYRPRPTKVQIEYNTCPPPFYKVPSLVGRQALQYHNDRKSQAQSPQQSKVEPESLSIPTHNGSGRTKLEMEQDPSYSPALNAAFEFASSLELGAAGHGAVPLGNSGVNALVSACVCRGALWRALQLVQDLSRSTGDGRNGAVSIATYNLLLVGLARVGDVKTMQDVTGQLLSAGLKPNSGTVRAIVTGLLNLGDVGSAITVVQDSFNQHSVLPPVSTLLTIVEHCLARDVPFEAKRGLCFIQQLWKFQPTSYHTPEFAAFVRRVRGHPHLQRPALEGLFAYFGHDLQDSDFL
jgi:hypothetical protein